MIEAKYFPEKSSYEDEVEHSNDQLARELDNLDILEHGDLGWDTIGVVVGKSPLYLTQDASAPSAALQESLLNYRRKCNWVETIYWTSWRHLTRP